MVARNATQLLIWNVPIRVKNSPMKPVVPGNPILARVNTMKATA